ncbi:MAG: bifunctional diaminohydroxyphosphoribosylaminopyrimidine deaminase/5-amino-6-(5-phosphoribosylamino)uracil reductase RibD [Magnetococcales bacterium]|nr:bifunctional diaminohydroxyphosphoribosylaminopyrimidine deaminase/5-amino-6-(5-phosphoribosylamino)uracil reductase RibD [Magnetococcales bacterium]
MMDSTYMAQALRLAARAEGRTRPNPVVGCVVVRENRVVGRGYHHRAGEPHAEVEALTEAGEAARGATVYVTLEPCSHTGRTPPCADALLRAGVRKVVAAMSDPDPRVSGSGFARLREGGVEVVSGVLEEEAHALNRPFVTRILRQRPLITLKMAATLDGKVATRTRESQWITGEGARMAVQRLRDRHDVVMTGIGSVLADDPRLNCRLKGGRDPVRLVVDSRLRIPPDRAIFSSSRSAPLWIATVLAPEAETCRALMERWGESGLRLLHCRATATGRVDLPDLMQRVAEAGMNSLLSEGGSELAGALVDAGLVDRLALFVAPLLFGGREAPPILGGLGVARIAEARTLKNLAVRNVGQDLLITGDFPG